MLLIKEEIMKLKINTDKIKALNPCQARYDNWLKHYDNFNGNILKFLELEKITPRDKIWVSVRVLPRELVEIFAIDCAFSASVSATASAAAYAAAYAAYAAADTAAYAAAAADAAAYAADTAAYAADAADTAAYAAAADADAYAADTAAYAAATDAAAAYAAATDAAAAYAAECENQIDALIMLIKGWKS